MLGVKGGGSKARNYLRQSEFDIRHALFCFAWIGWGCLDARWQGTPALSPKTWSWRSSFEFSFAADFVGLGLLFMQGANCNRRVLLLYLAVVVWLLGTKHGLWGGRSR